MQARWEPGIYRSTVIDERHLPPNRDAVAVAATDNGQRIVCKGAPAGTNVEENM
jgi:hypothetical protein